MAKEDLQAIAAELLFGQCLHLPGGIISCSNYSHNSSSSDIMNNRRDFVELLHSTATRV